MPENLCWFLEPELADEVRKMHRLVGNAIAQDRHIVLGTGFVQLLQAALYALSPQDAPEPMNVVWSDRWALVKDPEVARRMTEFVELNTIGVSKESLLRVAKILRLVREAYDGEGGFSIFWTGLIPSGLETA
ncbi:tryptophan aminotransferase-related protein 2-like protein [Cinnamomum micranthum f. kanehirae]|uniref:Tryptophan aminotransferase-related protein 2-like protein n=1 Tax=Cinnamomum micranthum f. kanehirae TaxID=337451 RepID=A0A3S4PS09_9MAGN|nr:tryptophan aminotransferase-related protein 2-like protein [Cinnamomum micranthum f. kanehirae]